MPVVPPVGPDGADGVDTVSGTGTTLGVTLLDGADGGPVPVAFVAVTVNV